VEFALEGLGGNASERQRRGRAESDRIVEHVDRMLALVPKVRRQARNLAWARRQQAVQESQAPPKAA